MGCKSAQGCAEGAQRVHQGAWVVALGNGMVGGWSGCGPTVKNRKFSKDMPVLTGLTMKNRLRVNEEMCGRHPGGAPTNRREATGAGVCIGWDFMTWHYGRYKCARCGSGAHSSGDGVQPGPFQQCTKHPRGPMVRSGVGGWWVQVMIVHMYELVWCNT